MNDSWGFNLTDHHYKSTRELIHYLVRAAGVGANLLLNIGPRPDGTIPPEAEERLREIGQWLATNGGAIYGTRAGPIAPRSWGVTTQRGDTVFVHVLDWTDPTLALPALGTGRGRGEGVPDGKVLHGMEATGGVTVTLPSGGDTPDRIVALTK